MGSLSPSCIPWKIHVGSTYHIERRDVGKYVLSSYRFDNTDRREAVTYLLERDLNVLFEEEDVFMSMIMMDNRKDEGKFATRGV